MIQHRFAKSLSHIDHPLLDEYQGRGAFAQYLDVLAEMRTKQARKEELEALFAEVASLEEGEWNETDYEVIPKA